MTTVRSNASPQVLVVIPARGGSKRLPQKNILPVIGVPMVLRVAREALGSGYSPRVVVTSEAAEVLDLCRANGIEVVTRPADLARDDTPKMAAVAHAVRSLHNTESYQPDIVVSLQPNSPEFSAVDLDRAIDFFRNTLYPGYPIKEVISVGPDHIQNGAFRIMTYATVFQRTLSTYVGIYFTDYLDVHTDEDLQEVEARLRRATIPERRVGPRTRPAQKVGPSIVVFLSDEGFGHIVRQEAVIREFLRRLPAAEVTAVTHNRLGVLREKFGDRLDYVDRSNNLYTVKTADGNLDIEASLAVLEAYPAASAEWLESVPGQLPEFDFAISDFVPEAFELCRRLGKPGFGVAHFTWDWFFRELAPAGGCAPIALMERYVGTARRLFFPPYTPPRVLERYAQLSRPVSFIINDFAAVAQAPSSGPGRLSCVVMDNGTNTLSRLIESALPTLAAIPEVDFVVAVDHFAPASVALVERSANLSPVRGLKEMHSQIPLVDFVLARGGFNTITECLITKTPALLVDEGGNPEVAANIAMVTSDGLAARITPEEFTASLPQRIRHFIGEEMPGIRSRLMQATFENSGPAEICEEILRTWRGAGGSHG